MLIFKEPFANYNSITNVSYPYHQGNIGDSQQKEGGAIKYSQVEVAVSQTSTELVLL